MRTAIVSVVRTRMRVFSLALAAAAAMAGFAGPADAMDVALKVQEPAGVARTNEPCRTGVPLIPGAITDEAKLCLLDDKGVEVPAQFRVISRRDAADKKPGDIEWVCVDFLANVAANGTAVYHLTDGGTGKPVDKPVELADGPDTITVSTGALKLAISKKGFAGLGRVWLDRTGSGKFTDDDLVTRGGSLTIEGMDGKTYHSTVDLTAPLSVKVEEAGPVHAVIRIDGQMTAQSDDGKSHTYPQWPADGSKKLDDAVIKNTTQSLGFTARIHVWKDQTAVRALVTTRVLNGQTFNWFDSHHMMSNKIQFGAYYAESAAKAGNFLVDAINMDLDLVAAGPLGYRFGGGLEGDKVHDGKLAADSAGVVLYQDTSADWVWQAMTGNIYDPLLKDNAERLKKQGDARAFREDFITGPHPAGGTWGQHLLIDRDGYRFMGYRLLNSARDLKPGPDSAAADLGQPLAEGVRAPGWMEVTDGKIAVTVGCRWFWQMSPKSLEVRNPNRLTVGLWPREFSRGHLFESRAHRTHELVYDFRPAGKGIDAANRFAAFDRPLVACPDARHNLASRVYGDFPLFPLADWPRYEKAARAAIVCSPDAENPPGLASSIQIEREKYDAYGVWNFGAPVEGSYHEFAQYLECDLPYCLMVQFARTGDYRYFREAEIATRHLLDIPAHGGGYGHVQSTNAHYYTLGPLLLAGVTGDMGYRESIVDSHKAGRIEHPDIGSIGIALWSDLDMRANFVADRATYDRVLKADVNRWRAAQDGPTGAIATYAKPADYGQASWFGIAADAMGRYAVSPLDDDAKDDGERLAKACKAWMAEYEKLAPADRDKLGVAILSGANGFAYAARFSGDEAFFTFAAEHLVRDKDFSPNYRTGSSSAKTWTLFSQRLTQTFLHDWDKKKHPDLYKDLP